MALIPFAKRQTTSVASRPRPSAGAQVVNLWVKRQERAREKTIYMWTCLCGWRFFEIIKGRGPVCEKCGRPSDVPR